MRPLDALKRLENSIDLRLADNRAVRRVAIARLADSLVGLRHGLHDAIDDDHEKALATVPAKEAWSTRHDHAAGPGELQVGVREHFDDGALRLLVLAPCLHCRPVVGAEDDDLSDASSLQLRNLLKEARNLDPGSARRVGAWEPQDDNLAGGALVCSIDRETTCWDETVVQRR